MSLKLMIYRSFSMGSIVPEQIAAQRMGPRTFSCLRCLSSFNSRYVRFDKTGVLKGFIIFFTATACPVS